MHDNNTSRYEYDTQKEARRDRKRKRKIENLTLRIISNMKISKFNWRVQKKILKGTRRGGERDG